MFLYNIFLLKVMQCHRQCFLSFSYKLALTRLYISVCSIGWQGLDGGRTQYTLELCKGAPPLIFGVSALLFPTAITKCRKMWRDRLEVVCRRAAVGVEMKPGPWGERRWDRFFFFLLTPVAIKKNTHIRCRWNMYVSLGVYKLSHTNKGFIFFCIHLLHHAI